MTYLLRVYPDDLKRRFVDNALRYMNENRSASATKAGSYAARNTLTAEEQATYAAPTGTSVQKWAHDFDLALPARGYEQQKEAAERAHFYSRERREMQRERLLSLIDLEIERTEKAIKALSPSGRARQADAALNDGAAAVNFAQRIAALSNAHGTLAAQSRSDQLHGVRMGDVDPAAPAGDLEDWNGNPDQLPDDIDDRIVDIEASRFRAATLTGATG